MKLITLLQDFLVHNASSFSLFLQLDLAKFSFRVTLQFVQNLGSNNKWNCANKKREKALQTFLVQSKDCSVATFSYLLLRIHY